jgi:pimeloyl-ACP methyl ester carboxylesterase
LGGVLKDWVEAPSLEPYRKIDGRQFVTAAMGTLERYTLTDIARQDYLASYEGERFAESMRHVRTYPEQLSILRDLLPAIETPVLIISGARDPVVPPANAEYLHERLPRSKLDIIDAGHFIWEDAADAYTTLVIGWWAGGYDNPGLAAHSEMHRHNGRDGNAEPQTWIFGHMTDYGLPWGRRSTSTSVIEESK